MVTNRQEGIVEQVGLSAKCPVQNFGSIARPILLMGIDSKCLINGAATVMNGISLMNTTSNVIPWNGTGFGPPTFTTQSPGAKLVLFQEISPSTAEFALGMMDS